VIEIRRCEKTHHRLRVPAHVVLEEIGTGGKRCGFCRAAVCGFATGEFSVVRCPGSAGVTLKLCHVDGVKEEVRCGVYPVF
jgi:hypothetical protein